MNQFFKSSFFFFDTAMAPSFLAVQPVIEQTQGKCLGENSTSRLGV